MSSRAEHPFRSTTEERAHRYTISIHCPNCNEIEMNERVRLAMIRDAAIVGMNHATDSAAVILSEVCKLATQAVYAHAPTSRLLQIRAALEFTIEAARSIERATRNG